MSYIKNKLDQVIKELHIQSVGTGYADLICPKENIELFIDEMNALGIKIVGVTWWCWVTADHTPCGFGGPKNKYGDGWFSEIAPIEELVSFNSNEELRKYLTDDYPKSANYRSCYLPAFWLPEHYDH